MANSNPGEAYANELSKLKKAGANSEAQEKKQESAQEGSAYASELSRLRKTEQASNNASSVNAENIYASEMAKLKKVNASQ